MDAEKLIEDRKAISALGGPTKVALLLNYDLANGGAQRVQNWLKRGIPSKVKVDHPELFLKPKVPPADDSAPAPSNDVRLAQVAA